MSAPSSFTSANANGWSSGCCVVGVATHVHDVDRSRRPDVDEVVRELRSAIGIPLERRHDHPLTAADADDALFGQRGHEGPEHRAERSLVGKPDRALDCAGQARSFVIGGRFDRPGRGCGLRTGSYCAGCAPCPGRLRNPSCRRRRVVSSRSPMATRRRRSWSWEPRSARSPSTSTIGSTASRATRCARGVAVNCSSRGRTASRAGATSSVESSTSWR